MVWSAAFVVNNPQPKTILSMYMPLPFASLAFVMMFYPLSRFTADVCCGRLKTVVVSLLILLVTILIIADSWTLTVCQLWQLLLVQVKILSIRVF